MGDRSTIEWTDATWNPIRGCSRVSPGCEHCYAERHALRFAGAGQPWHGLVRKVNGHAVWTGKTQLVESMLDQPLRWRKPRKIFVGSMSDLFHESVRDSWIAAVFGIMAAAPQHTFQVLTKRPERARCWFEWMQDATEAKLHECVKGAMGYHHPKRPAINTVIWPLPNVWIGVSVEDQAAANQRIPLLLQTPAAVRFLSCEPLLGPADLRHIEFRGHRGGMEDWDALDAHGVSEDPTDCDEIIDWVIAGGESGPGARPMHPDWARSLRDHCDAAGVPFFFKQWGDWLPVGQRTGLNPAPNPARFDFLEPGTPQQIPIARFGKKVAGNLLDGREHHAFPEHPPRHG